MPSRSSEPVAGTPEAGGGGPRRPLLLLKLGGGLITEKARPGVARPRVIRRLAAELSEALPGLREAPVLGHGSGSFGHAAAARHGIGTGPAGGGAARGIAEVQERAAALHRLVIEAFRDAGLPAFSVAPSSCAVAAAGAVAAFAAEPVALALEAGLIPVVYGDVVMDRERGAAILSTETVLEAVGDELAARGWSTRRALWAGATRGILGEDGLPLAIVRAEAPDEALRAAGGASATDVTGGMAHRLEVALRLARRGVPSWIGDGRTPGALTRALREQAVAGTRVVPPGASDGPDDAPGG